MTNIMTDLQIFQNDAFGEIRTIQDGDKVLFCGNDIAKALGYQNPRKAIRDHCKNHGVTNRSIIDKLGRTQETNFIDEGNLYRLIIRSKLPSAEKFEHWIFDDVLPTIRKHGMYATDELINNPDLAIAAFQALKDEREKNRQLQEQINTQKPLVEFANTVQSTKDNILVRECSKLASNYIGVDIGEKGLYQKLRDWKLVLKRRNEPSKLAYKQGVLEYVERIVYKGNKACLDHTTKVTPKGQVYIIKKLIKECETSV